MNAKKESAKKRVEESERNILEVSLKNQQLEQIPAAYGDYRLQAIAILCAENNLSESQQRFLTEFAEDGLVLHACIRARISISTYYEWCKKTAFKETLEEIRKLANESLEKMAIDLASGVYKKPVVSMGVLVAEESIRDTKMLDRLLKARMPEKFGDKVDVNHGGNMVLKIVDKETFDAI